MRAYHLFIQLLLFSSFILSCICLPYIKSGVQYLMKYGYMKENANSESIYEVSNYARSLRNFQRNYKLLVTGRFDAQTVAFMKIPRCGNSDENLIDAKRIQRYRLLRSKWSYKRITYKITIYTDDLSKCEIDNVMQRAFKSWSDVSPLTFVNASTLDMETPDIVILFGKGDHGDHSPFDGEGGVLAHAYGPSSGFGGDAHFDDDEKFTANVNEGRNLFWVATHEYGHSIGIAHSNDASAIMYPYYRAFTPDAALTSDDIAGVQAVYGAYESLSTSQSEFCMNPIIDAALSHDDGEILAFSGKYVYRIDDYEIYSGYPKEIVEVYPGLPSNINAAVYDSFTQQDLFFIGDTVYSYKDKVFQTSQTISDQITDGPDDIDASFQVNDIIYLLKDNKYYKLQNDNTEVSNSEGTSLKSIIALNADYLDEASISASFPYPGSDSTNYFFIGLNTYKYEIDGDNANLYYFGNTGIWWFGCPAEYIQRICNKGSKSTLRRDIIVLSLVFQFVCSFWQILL